MGIMFGGDPESFMVAPRMETGALTSKLGVSPIAAILDLLGVHRQVAKGPKPAESGSKDSVPMPAATSPSVLTEVQNALTTPPAPITPVNSDAPLTPWGKRWLESNQPLMSVDPDDYLR